MSGTNSSSEERLNEKYPHYKVYKQCQSRAFMLGSATLFGVAACTFIIMDHWLQRFRSRAISKNWFIAFPLLTGTVSAYVVTMSRTVNCQNMWMAMEEKHSVLTPAEDEACVNAQNTRLWWSENLHAVHETPLHYQKVGSVNCDIHIVGPIFFEKTVNSEHYCSIIYNFIGLVQEDMSV